MYAKLGALLALALTACAPPGVDVQPQASTHRGVADIIVRFAGADAGAAVPSSAAAAVWVLEVGMGGAGDAAAKLEQPQACARAVPAAAEVHCCAILVAEVLPASAAAAARAAESAVLVSCAWSWRSAAGRFERILPASGDCRRST